MKKMLHKVLSVLLAACFLLSVVPAPAAAAEEIPAGSVTNGTYTESGWAAGGNGSTTYTIGGYPVTLSKTATAVEGMENTFDITLKVETNTHTIHRTVSGAVVLVIDTSSSMKNGVSGSSSRIAAAKSAALDFLASYAGSDASATRMLAIVSFNSGASTVLSWTNVATSAGYQSAETAINSLGTRTGTNMQAGLNSAASLLSDASVSGYTKSAVLLSDGAPTQGGSSSGGNWGGGFGGGNKSHCDAAATAAASVRGVATLYTVCFGAENDEAYDDVKVGDFLRDSIASSAATAFNATSAADLSAAFKAAAEDIVEGLTGEGLTVTDPMADMITVTGGVGGNFSSADGQTYTWTLSEHQDIVNGDDTKHVYTYTYRVTLDVQGQNFEEGKYFPTNDPTYLNVDGQQYAFPVPGVTGALPRKDVSVTKVWADNDNQDGIRTASVTVQLKEGDRTIGEPVVLNAENGWTYTWDGEAFDLIEKSKGQFHVYTVEELDVPAGYAASATDTSGGDFALTVTNTHQVEKTAVTVTKVWVDADNQDGIRPASLTVKLNKLAQTGEAEVATVELTADMGWTYTFTDLDKNANGSPIQYVVAEVLPEGYTAEQSGNAADGYIITNTHAVAKTSVSGAKTWEDNNDQDGKRPESITINLLANGKVVETKTVTADDGWAWTFENVDQYANGQEIVYTVSEEAVAGYTATYDGMNVTNTHVPEVIEEIAGTKTWNDNNDQDGKRPESITINLLANGKVVETKTVTAADEWSWSFTNLPKYEAGEEIVYTITEEAVDGYFAEVDGYNVTNTHEIEKTSVSGTKTWNDADNQDGVRPESIIINLLANGEAVDEVEVTPNENGVWEYSFTDLDKYADGQEIVYTVSEEPVEGYESEINGYDVTNTHVPAVVDKISGTKTWVDNNNQDGIRPDSITINLLANGEKVESVTVTAEDNWTWSFTNLPKYEAGEEIVYTIEEEPVKGYSAKVEGYDVTNTHATEKITVSGKKTWDDNNNQDGMRPKTIHINLVADGVEISTQVVTAENGWTWTFADLDKYAAGKEIVYTVSEEAVADYTPTYDGFDVTNTHEIEKVTVSGTKTWEDNDDQDGKRPASITINLLADGEKVDSVTVTEADGWAYEFVDLDKYAAGKEIVYTVSEEAVADYTPTYDGFDVTNTHEIEKTSVTVTKTWGDNNNQDGKRPSSIVVRLLADGEEVAYKAITADHQWTWTFSDLDKYAGGKEIVYTITEDGVFGYETAIDGFAVTNTHEIEKTSVSGSKTWDDNDDQDGKRPESITINLLANGTKVDSVTVTAEDEWKWSFTDLDKYAGGVMITYTITEESVEDYETVVDGFNVTNTHVPEVIEEIAGAKTWVDADDQDGKRPESITINLLADGEKIETVTVTAEDEWKWSFTDLPKYAEGKEIVYTITEEAVEGYKTVVEGYNVTNTHEVEMIDGITVTKVWDDNDDQDGIRPESVTVNLLANGEKVASAEMKAGLRTLFTGDWTVTFEDLPKYADGEEIVYTVTEEAVEGYEATIDGFTITNTHEPETTERNVQKYWDDKNDKYDTRVESVKITLYANGKSTGKTVTLSEKNDWFDSFENLPKYEDGKEIKYTVKEASLDLYKASYHYDGTKVVVTNTLSEIPNTGDSSNVFVSFAIMGISAAAIFVLFALNKKKHNA